MSSQSDNEIIGDWNVVKGTHYHLIFALWLILIHKETSVEFYKGNDLLAYSSPSVPPTPTESLIDESTPNINLRSLSSDIDSWIQLKSTKSKWTVGEILKENLLINFIHNALESEKQNRNWKAWLVTQGQIDSNELINFINSPNSHRNHNKRLNKIIDQVYTELTSEKSSSLDLHSKIRDVAFLILKQIAKTESLPIQALKAQIDAELMFACLDRDAVPQIENMLIGAMIEDAAAGPRAARTYDVDWVNQIAQRPVIRHDLLDQDVISACEASVHRSASFIGFNSEYFAARELFENIFKRFLLSKETCFVLLGASGAGKSWVSANAAVSTLENHPRLLIPGTDFDSKTRLENLVASGLKRYSTANWNESQFLQKLIATAQSKGHESLIVIVDDLLPANDFESYRRNLGQLVRECKEAGVKIVLTCQQHVWTFLNLAQYIDPLEIFASDTQEKNSSSEDVLEDSDDNNLENLDEEESNQDASDHEPQSFLIPRIDNFHSVNHSFIITDFSPEEMEKAIRNRVPEKYAEAVINQFRLPAFFALRKPYFFARYLEKNFAHLNTTSAIPIADVDELLDWSVMLVINKAALELQMSGADLLPALESLTKNLWENRPQGITYRKAIDCLKTEIGEKGDALIEIWRQKGFLTLEGPIRFVEPLIADHIFAKFVSHKFEKTNFEFLNELDPQTDYGAVIAYLRQTQKPTAVAEKLVELNEKWTSIVVAGLAQTQKNDWRVLAMLSALLTKHQYSDLSEDIYVALGQLAARSNRAYKWVAEMYLGYRARTWRRGALAFISTVEYEPRRVEKAVRARLSRLVEINRDFYNKDKRKKWILVNALDPFRSIKHLSAARIGRKIINRYSSLAGSDDVDNRHRDWYFVDDIDEIRGQVAIFDKDEFTELLSDLRNNNPVIRYRAAQSLIKLAIVKPEVVKDILCERIEQETDVAVFKRLLVGSYQLIENFSDELLTSLSHSSVSNLTQSYNWTHGLVLELLGNIAQKNSEEVSKLLPPDLRSIEPDLQALLGEIFIYAWWGVNESSNAPLNYAPFEFFDGLDLPATTKEIRAFAIRSQAISLLARMCLDLDISVVELTGRQRFYPNLDKEFLYIDFGDFFGKNLSKLSTHQLFEQFKQLLLECVQQSDPVDVYPLSRLREALFRCGVNCLELLTDIAYEMSEPVPLLDALPHGWQAIRVISELLKMGKSDAPIVDFAKQVLSEQKSQSTVQADAESRELLAQLGLLENNPKQSILEQREASNRLSIFSASSNTHAIAAFTMQNPNKLLEYLEIAISSVDDVVTLYALVDEAQNWQAILIARVYARMVSERPIAVCEARELCEQMLISVRSMSSSVTKDMYETIYQNIFNLLSGKIPQSTVSNNFADSNAENIINKSHKLCAEILKKVINTSVDQRTKQWLEDLLYSNDWWEESNRFIFQDSLLIQGHGLYGIYFFPAVRLAFIVAGLSARITDPAARIMRERRETHKLLSERDYLLRQNDLTNHDKEMLQYAFEDIDKAALKTPRDERIENLRGGILLRMNKLAESEEALKKSLALPTSLGHFRARTLYDLACVYARQNRSHECHQSLLESAKLRPLDKEWMTKDSDLEAIRNTIWFQELLRIK